MDQQQNFQQWSPSITSKCNATSLLCSVPKMVSPFPRLLQRRLLCTKIPHQLSIKQVTKTNFADTLDEIKSHISTSDFIAVSLQNTGSFSAPWHRVSPFDIPDIAYFKTKYAAERFQVLQFAVCPFTVRASRVTAYPYNFHLFPRDELKLGMPSYSFSCQTSCLTSMAREGFDFNTCINDGISYLSRAQESAAKVRMGSPVPANDFALSTSTPPPIADALFVGRIKSRVKQWKKTCKGSSTKTEEALVASLRRLVLGSEEYESRPCMTIDVCSERQVQLVVKMLQELSDDLVPLIIQYTSGRTWAVRVVLTSSEEDKDLLQRRIQELDEEQNKKVRGFREVIDLISASQKPVVSHNSLNDFTFIHSKFLAPLPPCMDEFLYSLHLVFPQVIDVNHLMNEIGPLRKATDIPGAMSYLKNRFFSPIDIELPCHAIINEGKIHGHNVVGICQLFAKLCNILKVTPFSLLSDDKNLSSALENYANIFNPFSSVSLDREPVDGEVKIWTKNPRKVSCEDLVFLWGFRGGVTAGILKSLLQESHKVFTEEFDVRLVEKSCAIVVFWQCGLSKTFLDVMNNCSEICGPLREMISEGLRAAGYEAYIRACRLGLWEASLADSLDKALVDPHCPLEANSETKSSKSYQSRELMIDLDDL